MNLHDETSVLTILYADIENSTLDSQTHGDAYDNSVHRLHLIAKELADRHNGVYALNMGDGFVSLFEAPFSAALCAIDLQRSTAPEQWGPEDPPIKVRIGIHTDIPKVIDGHYCGFAMSRAQRIMDAANGAQILLSGSVFELVKHDFEGSSELICEDLGSFRLRDLRSPEDLYRLSADNLSLSTLPPRALMPGRHNFPEEDRPFIGRQQELADVLRIIREKNARLLTITGIGGIGKTRLAKQTAAELADEFPDGVWLVEMETAAKREEILPAICAALGVETDAGAPEKALIRFLQPRRLLLVLDCFERIADHAGVIDRLISRLPGLTCLVTSRILLGLDREFEYPLHPMQVARHTRAGIRAPSDGIALFAEAAGHASHAFAVTSKNRALVHEVCEVLEGIPLSIVLAASRLRHLSLPELVRQVRENRLQTVVKTRDASGRQSSLARVIADSFLLLPAQDRSLLCKLGIFVGGFYLEDARAVCESAGRQQEAGGIRQEAGGTGQEAGGTRGDPDDHSQLTTHHSPEPNTLNLGISVLVEHSLVQPQLLGDRTRYRLLDSVREYLETVKLGDDAFDEIDAGRRRHAEHFATIARQIDGLMNAGRWTEGTAALWTDIGNFRAAAAYSIDNHLAELVIEQTDAIGGIYFVAGLWADFEALAREAEEILNTMDRPAALGRLLGRWGALAYRKGDEEGCRRLWERRLDVYERSGDIAGSADTLVDLATQALRLSEFASATRLVSRAVTLLRDQENRRGLCDARSVQARIALKRGDLPHARRHAAQVQSLLRPDVDKGAVIYAHWTLGTIYSELGEHSQAKSALTTALSIAMEGDYTFDAGQYLLDLAVVYSAESDFPRAACAYVAANRIHTELGSRLKEESASSLARFENELCPEEWLPCFEEIRSLTWREIVDGLLNDKPLAGSPPHVSTIVRDQVGHGNDDEEEENGNRDYATACNNPNG